MDYRLLRRMGSLKELCASALLAALTLLAPSGSCRAQNGQLPPEAVVRVFFHAFAEERWADAAGFVQLADLDLFRKVVAANARSMVRPKQVTVEDLLRADPQEPRVVAEYELKRIKARPALALEYLSRNFAGVSDPDLLERLPLQEVASCWLEAQHPVRPIDDQLRMQGCSTTTAVDSVFRAASPTILGSVVHGDTAWVLFRSPWFTLPDSGFYGFSPQVAHLIREPEGDWRISPRAELLRPSKMSMTRIAGCPKIGAPLRGEG